MPALILWALTPLLLAHSGERFPLENHAIARVYLRDLRERGLLVRSGRGLYIPADADVTEHHILTEACRRVPHGVVRLSSALRFHELTIQNPWNVWLMLESGSRLLRVDYPQLQIFRDSGAAFRAGIEEHTIEGIRVWVYNLPKQVGAREGRADVLRPDGAAAPGQDSDQARTYSAPLPGPPLQAHGKQQVPPDLADALAPCLRRADLLEGPGPGAEPGVCGLALARSCPVIRKI